MTDDDDYTECSVGLDHETRTTYEDDEVWQGECTLCGAEFWEDKNTTEETTLSTECFSL